MKEAAAVEVKIFFISPMVYISAIKSGKFQSQTPPNANTIQHPPYNYSCHALSIQDPYLIYLLFFFQ